MIVAMLLWCLLQTDQAAPESNAKSDAPLPQMLAVHAPAPVTIDGRLDEAIWQNAPKYALQLSRDRAEQDDQLQEPGAVQFAYDEDFFYAAFHFTDTDVVQENDEDQQHHYRTGDVAELFLKPDHATWYWELYVTPNSKRTAFFFPSRGRQGLPSCYAPHLQDMRVAAQVLGTLNNWRDRDEGWTAEMAVPLAELAELGVPLSPENPWRILVGRYNFSRYLDNVELSMYPILSTTNYHRITEYAELVLAPPEKAE